VFLAGCKILPFRSGVRFLFGVSITPFFIAFIIFLMGIIWPGAPHWLLMILPLAIAIGWFIKAKGFYELKAFITKIGEVIFSLIRNREFRVKLVCYIVCCVCIFIVMIPLGTILVRHAKAPIIDHDISHYIMQARYFLEDGDTLGIDNYSGERDGTVVKDDHGPLWVNYISQALMYRSDTQEKDVFDDAAARVAIVITFFYMMISAGAVALILIYDFRAFLLANLLILMHKDFEYISYAFSRDGFRITSLLLFCIILLAFVQRQKVRQSQDVIPGSAFGLSSFLLLGIIAFFAMQGHGANVFFIFLIALAFGIMLIVFQAGAKNILLCSIAIIVGVLSGFVKNIAWFLETGSFRGLATFGLEGTEYGAAVEAADQARTIPPGWERVLVFIESPGVGTILIGSIGLLIMVFVFIVKRKELLPFTFAIFALCIILPMTGLFDIMGHGVSDWYFQNFRYRLPLYAFMAICGAYIIVKLMRKDRLAIWGFVLCAIILLVFSVASTLIIRNGWRDENNWKNAAVNYYRETAQLAEQLADDQRVLINNDRLAIHFKTPPLLHATEKIRPLLLAESAYEVRSILDENNIGVVHVSTRRESIKVTYFYRYLIESDNVEMLSLSPDSEGQAGQPIELFIINSIEDE